MVRAHAFWLVATVYMAACSGVAGGPQTPDRVAGGNGGVIEPAAGGTGGRPGAGGGSAGAPQPSSPGERADAAAATEGSLDAAPARDGARDGSAPAGGSGADRFEAGGPFATEGCANNDYPLCIDFETPVDKKWTGVGNSVRVGHAAHGTAAYHAPGGGMLTTTQLGPITNMLWGRFYVHMKPGAPMGHGEIIGAYDVSGDWYEIGWQFNGILGVWHGNGGEKPLRSKPFIVDQWYCVEFFFDGGKATMPEWWIDGQNVTYYMASNFRGPNVVTKFTKIEIGFRPFAGLSLTSYGGNTQPMMTDFWLDDIAFDVKRIGCIR